MKKFKIRREKEKETPKKEERLALKELSSKNQLIAIFGSPNSGKSTLAIKIARDLAEKKKNVIVVHDDMFCPTIPSLMPDLKKLDLERSLGKVFLNTIDQKIILDNIVHLNSNNYMGLLGYQKGENFRTYPGYTKDKAVDLLILLRHLAEYIIVDCSSTITETLTLTALEMADKVVTLSTADLKGLSYFKSTLPLLIDSSFAIKNHLKVISMVKDFQAKETINDILKADNIYLDYIEEIQRQFTEGKVFEKLIDKKSKNFIDDLEKIIKDVFYE